MARRRLAILASTLVALVGCGGGAGSKGAFVPKNPFPSRATIEKIAATPPKPAPAASTAVAQAWTVAPAQDDAPSPALDEKARAAVGTALRMTSETRCIARELARFYAEHGAYPDQRLRRFMLGACGATTATVFSNVWTVTVPPSTTDEQIIETWKPKPEIPSAARGGDTGFYLARKGERAVLMMAITKKGAELSISPVDPETHRIVIRGVVAADTDDALAFINRGASDVAPCERDASLALPQVAFACVLAPNDENAWIEVGTRSRGRLLARNAATILARRKPGSPIEYIASSHDVPAGADFAGTIVGAVNKARTAAGRTPLVLSTKQSAFNAKLAPHLIAAEQNADGETSDLIALGLLAGYDVEGTIRKGEFFFANLSGTSDVGHWLDYALDMPLGRFTLLAPDSNQIAVGASDKAGVGAVVTTYAFFGNDDHDADANRVVERIKRIRAAKGLPPPVVLGRLPGLVAEAKLVNASQREPLDALDRALASETERVGRSLRGWAFAGSDLDAIELPAELFAAGPLAIRVEVTHYRAEGAPWGSYLVYIVMPVATPQQTASLGGAKVARR